MVLKNTSNVKKRAFEEQFCAMLPLFSDFPGHCNDILNNDVSEP